METCSHDLHTENVDGPHIVIVMLTSKFVWRRLYSLGLYAKLESMSCCVTSSFGFQNRQYGAVAGQPYLLICSMQTGVAEDGVVSLVLFSLYMNDMSILHHVELAVVAVATFLKLTLLVEYL